MQALTEVGFVVAYAYYPLTSSVRDVGNTDQIYCRYSHERS